MFSSLSTVDIALNVSFGEAIQLARAADFAAVDLLMPELLETPNLSAQAVREDLDAAGLRAGGWWLPIEFRESEAQYRAELERLPRACKLAQALNSPWCITWIWPYSDELTYSENMELHIRRLSPVAKQLAEGGCKLGLEFVGPPSLRAGHKHEFVSTLPETLDLIDKLGSDNLGVVFDCWQWYTSQDSCESLAALEKEQIVYVHLNDAPLGRKIDEQIDDERMLPGSTGVIDIVPYLKVLSQKGFEGPVCAEPFNADVNALDPLPRAQVARESLSSVFDRAGFALS